MGNGSVEVLAVRVDKIEEEIKEIKEDAKTDRKILIQAVNELKENSIKITMFMEQTNEKMNDTDKKIDKLSSKIDDINKKPTADEEEKKWYRSVISNGAKYLLYALLILLCVSLGLKLEEVFGLLK